MTEERMFYIAYKVCDYIRNTNMQNQFEEHEFCMYVSMMAKDIKRAIYENDCFILKPYYNALKDELDNVDWNSDYAKEVKELIDLLDEHKIYK